MRIHHSMTLNGAHASRRRMEKCKECNDWLKEENRCKACLEEFKKVHNA